MTHPSQKKNRSFRGQAWKEEQYPEVSGLRCVEIMIPDDDAFMPQLAGLIAMATKQYQYQNVDESHAAIIARQWREAYMATDWEQCMSCEDVADCIETSEAVQDALDSHIDNYFKERGEAGQLMPTSEQNRVWGDGFNPACDPDIVWSESVAVVERLNTAIVDILESLSEADTVAKAVGVIASFPVVENLGISTLTDLATLVIEFTLTSYNDAYTLEWSEALECELFCSARLDCQINFIKLWNIIRPRIEDNIAEFVPPANFLDLTQWATSLVYFASELVEINRADMLFYFLLGGLAYGNVIINQNAVGAKILELAVILASDEPNNDWEALCEDCPPEPEYIVFDPQPYPVTGSGIVLNSDGGQFGGGDARFLYTPFEITITLPTDRLIQNARIVAAFATATGNYVTVDGTDYDLVRGTHIGGETYNYDATVPDIFNDTIVFQFTGLIALSSITITVQG